MSTQKELRCWRLYLDRGRDAAERGCRVDEPLHLALKPRRVVCTRHKGDNYLLRSHTCNSHVSIGKVVPKMKSLGCPIQARHVRWSISRACSIDSMRMPLFSSE